MKKKISALDIALVAVSVLYLLGILFVFAPCGPKEDGTYMNCHKAGVTVAWLAGGLTAFSLARLCFGSRKIKAALSFLMIAVSAVACFVPGHMVSLCMMSDMRCRAVTAPCVTVFSIVTIALALFSILLPRKNQNHA